MPADALPPDPPEPTDDSPGALSSDLLLALTHDLRSPLATVIHAAELLAGGRLDPDSDEWRRALALLIESAGDLQRANEDLLLLEQVVRAGDEVALQTGEVDVADLAREAQAATRARERIVDLSAAAVMAKVNPVLLRHVLEALLDNAAVHTRPEDRIGVEAHRDGNRLLLAVWDTGPGIATSDREAVFRPFQRRAAESGDGVGVGLHLVARFASALGGRVAVEPGPDGGARFCVDIPVAP